MKKYITLLIFSLLTFTGLSQDNGITYQAVIYNPNGQSLPGEDDGLSPLVETDICLKFSIMGNGLEYEETVQTTTDVFGMVNLKIPNGTKPDSTFSLKGKGIPQLGNPAIRGDHQVLVKVVKKRFGGIFWW